MIIENQGADATAQSLKKPMPQKNPTNSNRKYLNFWAAEAKPAEISDEDIVTALTKGTKARKFSGFLNSLCTCSLHR